jgi:hypothetical protein
MASPSDWRSMPTTRAACARIIPSIALAMASMRRAARATASPRASRRRSPGSCRSVRIAALGAIVPSESLIGWHSMNHSAALL